MNYWPLLGVAVVVAGFVLRRNPASLASAPSSSRLRSSPKNPAIVWASALVSELTSHLKDPDEGIRGNVALMVGALGTSAEIPALEPLLQDRNGDVRRAAERAIQRVKVRGA